MVIYSQLKITLGQLMQSLSASSQDLYVNQPTGVFSRIQETAQCGIPLLKLLTNESISSQL